MTFLFLLLLFLALFSQFTFLHINFSISTLLQWRSSTYLTPFRRVPILMCVLHGLWPLQGLYQLCYEVPTAHLTLIFHLPIPPTPPQCESLSQIYFPEASHTWLKGSSPVMSPSEPAGAPILCTGQPLASSPPLTDTSLQSHHCHSLFPFRNSRT